MVIRACAYCIGLFLDNRDIMKTTGIIAEYNPLHNGHAYHIEKAREITGCDAVVAAMSGDYVQRGEPAIMDKRTRAELALRSGADLVIEIPVLYCLGNAGQYAGAGVKLLESLGCVDNIAFGSECGDTELLEKINRFLELNSVGLEHEIHKLTRSGYSYPAARAKAYSLLRSGADEKEVERELKILESSNDILALEYMHAMTTASPVAVKREGAGYSDPYDIRFSYQSASALRTQFLNGRDISRYIPECTASALGLASGRTPAHTTGPDRDKWFDLLRYAVLSTPAEVIEDCPSGGEGLANLMKTQIMKTDSFSHFILRVKSRRYTFTRISRLCMQLILGITRDRYGMRTTDFAGDAGYIRVLGFSDRGRQLLAEIRNNESAAYPVVTNINKERDRLSDAARSLLDLDIHASDIYNLATGRDLSESSDHRGGPVIA